MSLEGVIGRGGRTVTETDLEAAIAGAGATGSTGPAGAAGGTGATGPAPAIHLIGEAGEPAFTSPWGNDSLGYKAGFSKMGNVLFMWGLIRNGSTGTTIFTLPVGFRPGTNDFGEIEVPIWDVTANVVAYLRVQATGAVIYVGTNGNTINIESLFYSGQ